ncbi:T-cell surface glycoprotein CD8 beta chain [Aulostomus maculatus]
MLLILVWALLTVSLWTSGSGQILQKESSVLYPKLLSTEKIKCDCVSSCDSVFWFRTRPSQNKVEFLGRLNSADREDYGDDVDKQRFKFIKRGSLMFILRIINVTEEDAGIYSCILMGQTTPEIWRPGFRLRPGVTPPTSPPKPTLRPLCPCRKETPPQDGCGSLILWPLVGMFAGLTLALVCTLYYFSRLPKKCRHRFEKKR